MKKRDLLALILISASIITLSILGYIVINKCIVEDVTEDNKVSIVALSYSETSTTELSVGTSFNTISINKDAQALTDPVGLIEDFDYSERLINSVSRTILLKDSGNVFHSIIISYEMLSNGDKTFYIRLDNKLLLSYSSTAVIDAPYGYLISSEKIKDLIGRSNPTLTITSVGEWVTNNQDEEPVQIQYDTSLLFPLELKTVTEVEDTPETEEPSNGNTTTDTPGTEEPSNGNTTTDNSNTQAPSGDVDSKDFLKDEIGTSFNSITFNKESLALTDPVSLIEDFDYSERLYYPVSRTILLRDSKGVFHKLSIIYEILSNGSMTIRIELNSKLLLSYSSTAVIDAPYGYEVSSNVIKNIITNSDAILTITSVGEWVTYDIEEEPVQVQYDTSLLFPLKFKLVNEVEDTPGVDEPAIDNPETPGADNPSDNPETPGVDNPSNNEPVDEPSNDNTTQTSSSNGFLDFLKKIWEWFLKLWNSWFNNEEEQVNDNTTPEEIEPIEDNTEVSSNTNPILGPIIDNPTLNYDSDETPVLIH